MNLKALLIVASLGLSAGLVSCATETPAPKATSAATSAPAATPAKDKADAPKTDSMAKPDAKEVKPGDAMKSDKPSDKVKAGDAMSKPGDAMSKPTDATKPADASATPAATPADATKKPQ